MNNLGYCHEYGYGTPQNLEKAIEYYLLAANRGDKVAAYNLGECYELGKGVEQDLDKALEWYRIAAERGDEDAQKEVQALTNL